MHAAPTPLCTDTIIALHYECHLVAKVPVPESPQAQQQQMLTKSH